MKVSPMLTVLVILESWISYVSGAFVKTRTWHEEFTVHHVPGIYNKEKRNNLPHHQTNSILYPRYKVCVRPSEKPEKLKQKSVHVHTKSTESTWSELLGVYSADSATELHGWNFWKHSVDPNKATRLHQLEAILVFIGLFILIFSVFVFFVPIVGRQGFRFYCLIWFVLLHPEIRRILRRLLITAEQISRKAMYILLPKSRKRSKETKKQFRLPFALREYDEEEVPAELIEKSEEESDGGGEVSSDGFENLLIVKSKRTAGDAARKNTRAIRYFMATTDQEMDVDEVN